MEKAFMIFWWVALVAIIALLVSRKADTPQVIQSIASGYGNMLGVAESPVTGETYNIDLSYPGESYGFGGMGLANGFGS